MASAASREGDLDLDPTVVARLARPRLAGPLPGAGAAAAHGPTPWPTVPLLIVLFAGGLFGYGQGVIAGAPRGMTRGAPLDRIERIWQAPARC